MTGKEIAAKLREALALMNDKGAHWVRGASKIDTEEGAKYCSIGAIRQVIYGDPWGEHPQYGDQPELPVTRALASVIGNGGESDPGNTIINWNDKEGRTWSDIEAAFSEAAQYAEAQD